MTRHYVGKRPGEWVTLALCSEIGSSMFFPPDDKPVARNFYGNAKAICSTCPVISECLAYGINEAYGVWGGTTPAERYEMRNRKAMSLNRPVLPPAY